MKKILILLSFILLYCGAQSQTFPNVDSVKKYIADSIVRNRAMQATTLNKAYTGVAKFLPYMVQDTANITLKAHGMQTFQRKDSSFYVYDTIGAKRWRKPAQVAGGAGVWGAVTGSLPDQTDLRDSLANQISNASWGLIKAGKALKADSAAVSTKAYTDYKSDILNAGKVDKNSPIAGASKTKITYDAKGLVTAGADAGIADITGLQTALDAKQATLVSGTNIKTINGASVLGSGDLTVSGTPPGGNEEIPFKRNGAFAASDSAKWTATGFEFKGKIIQRNSAGTEQMRIFSDNQVNTFAGYGSGISINFAGGGTDNTGFGHETLTSVSTGTLNTAVGKRALITVSTGGANTGVGAGAAQKTTGSNNVAMGYHALLENSTASNNTAIGTNALQNKTGGNDNTVVGFQAAGNATGAFSNVTAVGTQALIQSTGNNNTAIGYQSMYSNTAGTNNTALGYAAGYGQTGSGNVLMGYLVGLNASTRSNRLMIDNSNTDKPLIDGDFNADSVNINGQLGVNAAPAASAQFEVASTSRGALLPRMTTAQRNAISSPAEGLLVFDTDINSLYQYTGSAWLQMATVTGTETLTNKRITKRTGTTASSSSLTINADDVDVYTITALAANLTINAPTGTPTEGQTLLIRIKDNGTGRTLTFNSVFRALGVTLPTTTVANKTMYIGCIWNVADSKYDVVSVNEEL